MGCLKFSDIIDYHNNTLNEQIKAKIDQHLQSCPDCRKKMEDYAKMHLLLKKTQVYTEFPETEKCYDEIIIASYIEGKYKRKEKKKFYKHVTQCDLCLNRLIAVESLLSELKSEGLLTVKGGLWRSLDKLISLYITSIGEKLRSSWQRIMKPRPVYRLAGVMLVLLCISLLVLKPYKLGERPIQTRETDIDVIETEIQLLFPANRTTIKTDKPEFRWTQTSTPSSYHFLLLNSNGDILIEKITSDTRMILPNEIQLQPSMTYFWQVEAYFEQGFSVVSDMIRFTYVTE